MTNRKIPTYFKEYLDERFDRLEKDIEVIKKGLDENGDCLHRINTTMTVYKMRVRNLMFMVIAIIIVMILGVFNGVELVTKGILGFL